MKQTFRQIIFLLCILALYSCSSEHFDHPTARIETPFGNILVEVYPDRAPESSAAFLQNIDSGIYKNSNFYRVLKAEEQVSSADKSNLIQGGIHYTRPEYSSGKPGVPLETTEQTGLKHVNGTISFARAGEISTGTEFFICIGDSPAYDYGGSANPDGQGFGAFGKVIRGMDVVKKIHSQPSNGSTFTPPVRIINIVKISSGDK